MKLVLELRNPFRRSSNPPRAPRRRALVAAGVVAVGFPLLALASPVTIPNAFSDGDLITAAAFNENFDAIAAAINDNDARIASLEDDVGELTADALFPPGTVAFFNSTMCPAGWIELQAARGRVIVGMNGSAGTLLAQVGTALGDEATRTINEAPSHSHPVSLSGTAAANANNVNSAHVHTIASSGGHSHPVDSSGAHQHVLPFRQGSGFNFGVHWGGSSSLDGGVPSSYTTPSNGAHSHTIPTSGAHSHTVQSSGAHSHSVSVSGSTAAAGAAEVDVTMPYLQLLTCTKE
jgi:hypothetical protein